MNEANMSVASDEDINIRRSTATRKLFWLSYAGLHVILLITSLPMFLPEGVNAAVVLAVKLIPLNLVIFGLLKDKLRSYAWICFIVLLYFTRGVLGVFNDLGNIFDWAVIFFSSSLFLSAMFYIKWQKNLGREL